uniref:NADH dehydrogenase subunit 4L n=1 Tax=Oligozaptyx hedleyi TaxID=1885786 RepID=A0A224A1Z2_9EUPU|nr:NADH dehydrogenase subunit 4L [Oligozaptyx hedleyi]
MMLMLSISFFMLLSCHFFLYSIYYHFLSALLVLESMVLKLLVFTVTFSFILLEGLMIYLFVLTLSVCEAALGLTLLISLKKMSGKDMITSSSPTLL